MQSTHESGQQFFNGLNDAEYILHFLGPINQAVDQVCRDLTVDNPECIRNEPIDDDSPVDLRNESFFVRWNKGENSITFSIPKDQDLGVCICSSVGQLMAVDFVPYSPNFKRDLKQTVSEILFQINVITTIHTKRSDRS